MVVSFPRRPCMRPFCVPAIPKSFAMQVGTPSNSPTDYDPLCVHRRFPRNPREQAPVILLTVAFCLFRLCPAVASPVCGPYASCSCTGLARPAWQPPLSHGRSYPSRTLHPRCSMRSVCGRAPTPRPASAGPSDDARWVGPHTSTTAARLGDRHRDAVRSPPRLAPTPPGTASNAQGSRPGRGRPSFCGVCAASASSRSFRRTLKSPFIRRKTAGRPSYYDDPIGLASCLAHTRSASCRGATAIPGW